MYGKAAFAATMKMMHNADFPALGHHAQGQGAHPW